MSNGTPLCAVCGAPFTIRRRYRWPQIYCSKPCRAKGDRAKRPPGDRHKPRYADCSACGKHFEQTYTGRGIWSIYCSRACAMQAKRSIGICSPIRWAQCSECQRWFSAHPKRSTCSRECYLLHGRRRFRENWVSKRETNASVEKHCKECGQSFAVNYYADRRKFCSKRCLERFTSRHRKLYERAGKRAASLGIRIEREKFKNVEIFERDRWTCKLCSKPTSRVYSPNDALSPTVDHIVPLQQGGHHTRENVQLAHLLCNSKKGHRGGGQPRLPI